MILAELFSVRVGPLQSRISESFEDGAPTYKLYGQSDVEEDLYGIESETSENKQLRTRDEVAQLETGDLTYNLISGTAVIVGEQHAGYIYTQNIAILTPLKKIDKKFFVYLLNEDSTIRRQLLTGLQGSKVLKHTVGQIRSLELPKLPARERQEIIGELYYKQLKLQSLRVRRAKKETGLRFAQLERARK